MWDWMDPAPSPTPKAASCRSLARTLPMTSRSCVLLVLLLAGEPAPAASAAVPTRREAPPEGVVVVVLDDVSQADIDQAPTPTLDGLAQAGRTYSVVWAGPTCSNGRAQLVSGRYAFRKDNRMGSNAREDGVHRLAPRPELLPARITGAGGTATLLGKWHLAARGDLDHPLECGFSHAAGTQANLEWTGGGDYFQWEKIVDGVAETHSGYLTTDTVDDALVEVSQGTDLIFVMLHAAHSPLHCPPLELAPISGCHQDSTLKQKKRAMIEAADTELGRLVIAALAADYTLFVTGDNGPFSNDGGKFSVYENGLQVPLYAIGHGVAPGQSAAHVSLLDFAPTVLELLGIDHEGGWFDGLSFADELAGGAPTPRYLFAEHFVSGSPAGLAHRKAIRFDRWKLHTGPGYPPDEFYDLASDPSEEHDLLQGSLTTEQEQALADLRAHVPQ